jgi:hypothetical protein
MKLFDSNFEDSGVRLYQKDEAGPSPPSRRPQCPGRGLNSQYAAPEDGSAVGYAITLPCLLVHCKVGSKSRVLCVAEATALTKISREFGGARNMLTEVKMNDLQVR